MRNILSATYFVMRINNYSEVPNSSGVPNKCMVAYNFFDLLHKNARFWSFLAYFWFKINSRGATTIRHLRVLMITFHKSDVEKELNFLEKYNNRLYFRRNVVSWCS